MNENPSSREFDRAVLLIGGGGHAAVVAEAVQARGSGLVGFLDDDPETAATMDRIGATRLGSIDDLERVTKMICGEIIVHAATGNPELRRRWLRMTAGVHNLTTDPIIHPAATVSPSARIGEGAFIGPGAVVNARALIGRGVIINSGAIAEHDVRIGDFAHIAPGSVIAGAASIGEAALVGCGAVVLPGVDIGRSATLGAGAVATRDIPPGGTAVGAPARVLTMKTAD